MLWFYIKFCFFSDSVYLFILELLYMPQNPVSYKVTGIRDRILYGYSFRNITGISRMEECLAKCLEECKCLSFQMCKDDMCQLCSKNSKQNEGSIQQSKGCMSFVFERDQPSQVRRYLLIFFGIFSMIRILFFLDCLPLYVVFIYFSSQCHQF